MGAMNWRSRTVMITNKAPARLLVLSLLALVLVQRVGAGGAVQPLEVAQGDVAQLGVGQLRLAAEQGDARAQTELGARYENGRGVARDYRAAVSWFRRAAARRNLVDGPVVPSGRRTGPRRRAEGTGPRPVNLAGGVKHLERRAALMDAGPVMTHSTYNWRSDSVGRHRPARARDWRHLPSRSSVKRTASRPVTLASSSASSGVGCRPIG